MKKETTLEQAAERLYPVNNTGSMFMASRYELNNILKQESFIEGAKWQAERMYSEEEVFSLMCKAFEAGYKKYDVVEAGLEGLETEIECNWILKNK
jgi:hypothetical protein